MRVVISDHACQRFCERVEPCSIEEARASIASHSRVIEKAAEIGCFVVRLGTGHRLILERRGNRERVDVLTVYEPHHLPRQFRNSYHLGDGEWL